MTKIFPYTLYIYILLSLFFIIPLIKEKRINRQLIDNQWEKRFQIGMENPIICLKCWVFGSYSDFQKLFKKKKTKKTWYGANKLLPTSRFFGVFGVGLDGICRFALTDTRTTSTTLIRYHYLWYLDCAVRPSVRPSHTHTTVYYMYYTIWYYTNTFKPIWLVLLVAIH